MANSSSPANRPGWRVALDVGIPALMVVAGTVAFEAGSIWPSQAAFLFWTGVGVLVLLVLAQIMRAVRANRLIATTDTEINDLRLAMKNSIAPVARLLAGMPNLSPGAKRKHVLRVADKATSVTAYLLLRYIPKVRANVFALNEAGTVLVLESHGGDGDPPNSFDTSTEAGRIALAWTQTGGEPLVVADTATDTRPGISNDSRYRSFVAVVIRSGPYSYGMLTIDSPEPDAFTEGSTEVETAKVVAELLAVGYASL
ncbi:hypothetical protein E3T26_10340 [Cryobacterium sp. TMT1-21]|uniref:GAF domain-containing protein n=1 Tax=Cryobacterium sp. TMT1-21 TaxID=1259234 RepID=UPI001069629E|nr:GAF domain-containing protein [Cryobacterium sp. TMT1-21]TFD13145.1 hypothetical protein E3T26_10340 [Cryobacterium sp. TMT1-21]